MRIILFICLIGSLLLCGYLLNQADMRCQFWHDAYYELAEHAAIPDHDDPTEW